MQQAKDVSRVFIDNFIKWENSAAKISLAAFGRMPQGLSADENVVAAVHQALGYLNLGGNKIIRFVVLAKELGIDSDIIATERYRAETEHMSGFASGGCANSLSRVWRNRMHRTRHPRSAQMRIWRISKHSSVC